MDKKSYFVILFHPETLTNINVLDQVNELLNAIKNIVNINMYFRNERRYLFGYNKKKNKGLC